MTFLSTEELATVARVLSIISARAKRATTLNELLERWDSTVTQIEQGYELTGYDYADDLATRDLIEEVIASSPPAIQEKIMKNAIDSIDSRFRAATRALSKPLTLAGTANPSWWWLRTPKDLSGDLARDLLERK